MRRGSFQVMRSAEIEAMARSERESETNVCHLSREGNKRKRVAARPKMVHYDFGFLFFRGKMILGTWAGTCAGFKCKLDKKDSIEPRIVGLCKKPTNRTNWLKLIKLLPNFRFNLILVLNF